MIEEPQANTRTFKIEPDDHGGRTKTATINRHNVLPAPVKGKGRGKKPPITSHILLGFDTEYQAVKTEEAKKAIEPGARNQLLSYQFAVKVIHKDHRDAEAPEVTGIIIPDGDTRLSLDEYVTIALGSLIDKYPDIQLPPDIYLIGHYTRADMPAFSDFKDKATAFLSNVRSTFLSIDRHMPLEIRCGDGSSSEFKVRVRDTMLLAPAGAKSLADIGKIVGFEKLTLDPDPAKELHIKENMADFRRDDWQRFREYAIRDAEVCIRYAEKLIWQSVELFDEFKMPATLTGFGTKLVQADWKERGKNADELLGRETVQDRSFSKRHGHFKLTTRRPLVESAHLDEAFVTESYHGGRNEQFMFGPAEEGSWRDHDLSSAYTTAMSLIGEADWEGISEIKSFEGIDPLDLAFFSVDFQFPEHVRFPTLPVRTANGIIFPRRGNSKCAAPELDLAIRLGAKISRFRRAIYVPSNRSEPIFRNFIQTCIQKRGQFKKGTLENLLWKEIGNSTYGKTAQGLRKKRVYDLRDDDMAELPESEITQPYFASFITSHVRAVLGEILNGFSDKVDVFSVTTDGFLSNASDEEIANATSGPLFRSFADARRALDPNESQPLEIKHTIGRPIGWRTRGSATLVPGDDAEKLVLQKGGIKTPELMDEVQQNSHIINLFLARDPRSDVTYKSAVSLRQMIQIDTDFVFRPVKKRLSMEFDWKRKPVNVRDVTFEFEGRQYTHVAFDTVPIVSNAEFNHVRDTWERYIKASVRNIKSVRDYEAFALYRDTNVDHHRDALKYLGKQDGHLNRLRRDLCRAFKKQAAGFDIECGRKKISHIAFRDALRACGVPCELTDVENGKKAEFKPHQTFGTPRCIEALQRLKDEFYPNLDIQAFLVEEATQKTENPLCRLAA